MAEEYLKKKHKGGDQDASLLEGAVKTVELRNGKSSSNALGATDPLPVVAVVVAGASMA